MAPSVDRSGNDAEHAAQRLRRAQRRWRWGVVSTAVLAVVLVTVVATTIIGSGDGDRAALPAATSTTAPPVLPSAASEPGTPLGDGFSVADGTTLIGDPIPIGVASLYQGEPILDQGWTATSIVDGGDPLEIVEAYLRQAADAGLAVDPGAGCTSTLQVTTCSGFARSPDHAEPRSLSVAVVRGRREDVVSDHVVVRYSTTETFRDLGRNISGTTALAVPDPVSWPPSPSPGEELGTAGEVIHRVEVQEGSRLAGPPRLNMDDATGGIVALLEVTGDPRSVLDRYLADLTGTGLSGSGPEARTIRGAVVTTAGAAGAGGDHFSLTMVERAGRPTWLEVSGSHD